jgi:hypothetical protein
MKNNQLQKLLLLLLLCIGYRESQAQTTVQITTAGDTTWFGAYCGYRTQSTSLSITYYLDYTLIHHIRDSKLKM